MAAEKAEEKKEEEKKERKPWNKMTKEDWERLEREAEVSSIIVVGRTI